MKRTDQWARWGIAIGGILIIGTVALMLLLIVNVSIPLFRPVDVNALSGFTLEDDSAPLALGVEVHSRTMHPHALRDDGLRGLHRAVGVGHPALVDGYDPSPHGL